MLLIVPFAEAKAWCGCSTSQPCLLLQYAAVQVMRNGSHSIHSVQDDGISVASADGQERLHIHSLDAPLVAMGDPIPFPNACVGPDMEQGMSFNLVNNGEHRLREQSMQWLSVYRNFYVHTVHLSHNTVFAFCLLLCHKLSTIP